MSDIEGRGSFVVAASPARPPEGLAGAVLAIGNFDGVHRGHQAVIARAQALARAAGTPCVVLTFEPHPIDYFRGAGTVFRLTPQAEKARQLEMLEISGMIVLPFDQAMAGMPAESFVRDILVSRLRARAVVVGYDFHFGAGRTGTPEYLRAAAHAHGFGVEIVPRVEADEHGPARVPSSTAIRAALERGDVAEATLLLGRPYAIVGKAAVPRCDRALALPLVSLRAEPSCRLRYGTYAARVAVDGQTCNALVSRTRGHSDGELQVLLLDLPEAPGGQFVQVDFVDFLRGEQPVDALGTPKGTTFDIAAAFAALARMPCRPLEA